MSEVTSKIDRSGRKKKLDDRDTRKLLRLDKNNRSLPLQDITRKFNENREDVFSSVAVRRCLYRNNFHQELPLAAWDEMKKLYGGPYIDAFCQVWFHLAQLFQRSRLKYEKVNGRQVMAIPHMTLWVR